MKKPSALLVPALYMAERNKVWQLNGTNDWITLSHCQGVILTLNKGERRKCVCVWMSVCVCVWERDSGLAQRHRSLTSWRNKHWTRAHWRILEAETDIWPFFFTSNEIMLILKTILMWFLLVLLLISIALMDKTNLEKCLIKGYSSFCNIMKDRQNEVLHIMD